MVPSRMFQVEMRVEVIVCWLLLAGALGGCGTVPGGGAPVFGMERKSVEPPARHHDMAGTNRYAVKKKTQGLGGLSTDKGNVLPDANVIRLPISSARKGRSEQPTYTESLRAASAPAVMALVMQANDLTRSGNRRRAAARLERALRLQPRNPYLWHELARIRCQDKSFQVCESLAIRSNRLDDSDALSSSNWALIAVARNGRGDLEGAVEARRMAGKSR